MNEFSFKTKWNLYEITISVYDNKIAYIRMYIYLKWNRK